LATIIKTQNNQEILNLLIRKDLQPQKVAIENYTNKLLNLTLEKTKDKYGEFTINQHKTAMQQSRVINLIQENKVFRVIAAMTSKEREQKLRPIRIPLYKGLLGYRIFLIRAEDQPLFSAIETVEQLKSLKAVQGHDWPDSDVLESNHFTLHRLTVHQGIYHFLSAKRADYFPIGISEIMEDLLDNNDLGLAIENSLML